MAFAIGVFWRTGSVQRAGLWRLGTKLAVFGILAAMVIPASIWVSDRVDASFADSLAAASAATEQATAELESSNASADTSADTSADDNADWWSGIVSAAQDGVEQLTKDTQAALDSIGASINNIVDTLAAMIVTSCLIPLAVLAFFFWLANTIVGLNIGTPGRVFQGAHVRARKVTGALRRP